MAEENKDIRDIDNFDTLTNLQALIVDDLKKLGVKIPHRRDFSCMRAPPTEAQKVHHFKNYLGYVPCYYLEQFGHVPSFLVRAAAIIDENISVEGIFRKSGSVSRQKKVEEEIEHECDVSSANVFDITSLIKQFFRELREPLLTNFYHDPFLKCMQLWNNNSNSNSNNSGEAAKSEECPIVKLCLLLPPEHLSTLRFTMNMFAKIAAASEQNKMNMRNLSLVMAPSIMHSHNKGDKVTGMEEKLLPLQTLLLELLISEEKNLGLVSASLFERAETMTACFGNVLEPDSGKVPSSGQKKKERRSGSLQGFVSTIAHSFTRWHRSGNSRSSLSHSSPDLSKLSETSTDSNDKHAQQTPVILGKRKAPREMASVGLSASKRKAIICQQPLLPDTPSSKKLTSKNKDVSSHHNFRPNMVSYTPNRIKTSPTRKIKRKPFFQVLCASKNSKKMEEIKSLETTSKESDLQEIGRCRESVNYGKGSRRRKRSASPFRRFMKKKKSENIAPSSSPLCPVREMGKHRPRRSSTSSCYSPRPTAASTVVPVSTDYVNSWINANHTPVKSVARNLQNDEIFSFPAKPKQAAVINNKTNSLITDNGDENTTDSDDGFSTISGGTVIFVGDATKKSDTPLVSSTSNDKKMITGSNKYNLKSCNYDTNQLLHARSQSVETRRTSLNRLQHDHRSSMNNNKSKKRSYSATDTKTVHRPTAVANLKVTGETKKILRRAQVSDERLIQPGSMMYCPSPVIVDQKPFQRKSSVNASLRQTSKPKVPEGHRSSSFVCEPIIPKQKCFSPAISKADVLLRHFDKTENVAENCLKTNGQISSRSPQWTRCLETNGHPSLRTDASEDDCISAPTPTKCLRLRRVSSPLSVHRTEEKIEVTGAVETPGNRRQTEYKQMIKACLNSPNLYKGGLLEKNISETCLRRSPIHKRRHRSLDGACRSNVAEIRQKFLRKEFEKREQKCDRTNPNSNKKLAQPFVKAATISLEKENSVFLSPAPILKYRKEQLPMIQINVEKESPSPRQVLQDCNKENQLSLPREIIKTPIRDVKNVHIKPALVTTPIRLRHQIVTPKGNTPVKAIARNTSLFDSASK